MNDLTDFLKMEKTRLQKEREEQLEEFGIRKFFRIPVGTTEIEFMTSELPREMTSKFGNQQRVFYIKIGAEEYSLGVNLTNPLYREIINALAEGKYKLKITRTGTGIDTRYSLA
jgi:hypothetical protein